jgi:hypothetical protein
MTPGFLQAEGAEFRLFTLSLLAENITKYYVNKNLY